MSTELENLFKTEQEIKEDIISDFASELVSHIEKLVAVYGKEELMGMILKEDNGKSENMTQWIV